MDALSSQNSVFCKYCCVVDHSIFLQGNVDSFIIESQNL